MATEERTAENKAFLRALPQPAPSRGLDLERLDRLRESAERSLKASYRSGRASMLGDVLGLLKEEYNKHEDQAYRCRAIEQVIDRIIAELSGEFCDEKVEAAND